MSIGDFLSFSFFRSFDVMPDGQWFLVVLPADPAGAAAARPRMHVILNWFEELRERL